MKHPILMLATAVALGWSEPALADDVSEKLCAVLSELVADTKLAGEDAKTAFNMKLGDAFGETPQTLGMLVRKGDELAEAECPDLRSKAIAKLGVNYLTSAMY